MEPCGITRLCVRIVSVNVQESASLKAYQIDRLLNGCGNHQKYQRGCDHRSLSVYSAGGYLTVDHQHLGCAGVCRGRRRSDRRKAFRPSGASGRTSGAYGVVVNAPIADEVITEIKQVVDIPVIATIASVHTDVRRKLKAGADILNVSGAAATASMVAEIRKEYPDVAIIATGEWTNESILRRSRQEPMRSRTRRRPTASCLRGR